MIGETMYPGAPQAPLLTNKLTTAFFLAQVVNSVQDQPDRIVFKQNNTAVAMYEAYVTGSYQSIFNGLRNPKSLD